MKMIRGFAQIALLFLAAGCFLTPGKFDAALMLRKDGSFTYRYTGEIVVVTGQNIGSSMDVSTFDPEAQTCWSDGTGEAMDAEQRECTPEDIAAKRAEFEEQVKAQEAQRREENEKMRAAMGGMDPSDPKTMDEFARRLEGHEGWKKVVHKGDGVFDVDYEMTGRLGHDYVFPIFPGIDVIIPFVQAARLDGGKVRVTAPAFVQGKEPSLAGMSGMGGQAPARRPEGRFTVTTDAEILANNTNDGPAAGAGGMRVLTWTVGPLDAKKPEALLAVPGR
jgi:hypothetical protein